MHQKHMEAGKVELAIEKIKNFLGSKYFLWLIFLLLFFQAGWIALSTHYPSAYDEEFHVGIIEFYTHQYSPIITNQPESYDYLRDLSNESSHFFHYLMSFPYRILSLFISSFTFKLLILRFINILFVIAGLYFFRKVLQKIGVKEHFIHLSLLLFVTIPLVVQLTGVVNYDNLLFLITPLFLLACLSYLDSSKNDWKDLAYIIVLGCLASLVKYTFLPIFAFGIVYLIVKTPHFFSVSHLKLLSKSFKTTRPFIKNGLLIISIASITLFSYVYVRNIVLYKTPQPACERSFVLERCLKSDIVSRNIEAEQTKHLRELQSFLEFSQTWVTHMLIGGSFAISDNVRNEREIGQPLPAILNLYFVCALILAAVLIYSWRTLPTGASWNFLALISFVLIGTVFVNNYMILLQFHVGYAIQARYIFPVLPIILAMSIFAFSTAFSRFRVSKLVTLLVVTILLTQGSGVIAFMLRSRDTWYIQHPKVINANRKAQSLVRKLVVFE